MKLQKISLILIAACITGIALECSRPAEAQTFGPTPCNQWSKPPMRKPGTDFLLQLTTYQGRLSGVEGYLPTATGKELVPGIFLPPAGKERFKISIWDYPSGKGPRKYFTAANGLKLFFKSDLDGRRYLTTYGIIDYPVPGLSEAHMMCVIGPDGRLSNHRSGDDEPDVAEMRIPDAPAADGEEAEPARPLTPKIIRPRPPAPTIGSLMPKPESKATPEKAPPKTPIAELMPATKPPVTAAKPAVADAGRDVRICLPPALKQIPWPANLDSRTFRPEKPIIVGKRTVTTTARLYEYIDVSSSYIPKGEITLKKAPSFLTAIEFAGRAKTEVIDGAQVQIVPVTIPGVDLSAAVEVPKTGVPLKIMVVGAPEEISISGLERIGKELEKDAKLDIKLEIEWHEVTATGDIMPPVTLEGLPALVRAAREKAKKDFFITPDEKQFSDFIKKFTSVMTSRSQPVDRVIWVKGAYKLPNTAPVLVQDLLDAVAAGRAVPRTPSGDIERWLYVVTARMPGFSVNYVKEPVNAGNAGAVFMEPETGGPTRRLLDGADAATFVRNISGAAMVRARTGPAAAKPAVSKVVLNANELLAERGYLLSPVTLKQLAEKLRQLSAAWDADGRLTATAAEVVKAAGKASSDSIADVVEPILPMLNPFAGGVVSTSIMSHNPTDQKAAADFVKALAKLSDEMAKELNAEGDGGVKIRNCDFVYMSSNRIMAAAADAKAPEAPAGAPEEVPAEEPAEAPAEGPETPAATAPPPADTAPDAPADAEPAVAGPKAAAEPPPAVPLPDPREGLVPGDMRENEEMPPPAAADPALKGPAP